MVRGGEGFPVSHWEWREKQIGRGEEVIIKVIAGLQRDFTLYFLDWIGVPYTYLSNLALRVARKQNFA